MKYLTLLLSTILVFGLDAQEAADRKIQAGLEFSTGLNLNETATKRMTVMGPGNFVSIGVGVNYGLTNTLGFYTGISVDFEKNEIAPSEDLGGSFYRFSDTRILNAKDIDNQSMLFQWEERTQKPVYLTIPTQMLFRTKFFGYYRFFGKFGLKNSILLDNKIDDRGFTFEQNLADSTAIPTNNNNMTISKDMNFFRSALAISMGMEWNFSGPTSLVTEVGYNFGFVPVYRDTRQDNRTVFYEDNGEQIYYNNSMRQNQLTWKIAVLF